VFVCGDEEDSLLFFFKTALPVEKQAEPLEERFAGMAKI